MIAVLIFILVLFGLYYSIEAVILTALAEAYAATYKMLFLAFVFILCGFYIYLTRFDTVLSIIL